jgi:hypothetical protein
MSQYFVVKEEFTEAILRKLELKLMFILMKMFLH